MTTKLDAAQVIQQAYDEANNRIRTDASLSASSVTVFVDIDEADDSIVVYGNDGSTNRVIRTDANGELQIDVLSSALPTGAATESTLSTLNGKVIAVDTGAVTVISSVLPTGAATSALQITGNASLASIDAKLTSPLTVTGPLTDVQLRATPVPVSGTISANPTDYALQLDDTSTPNVTYVGYAAIGSSTASAVWRIKKIDETSGLVITWADSDNNFNNIWDNRTSLTYG